MNETDYSQYDEELNADDKMALEIEKRRTDNDRAVMKMIGAIIRKSEDQLTLENKRFLKARVSYLTKSQREEYADILNTDWSDEAIKARAAQEAADQEEDAEPREKTLDQMNRVELEAKGVELGMDAEELKALQNKKAVLEAVKNAI